MTVTTPSKQRMLDRVRNRGSVCGPLRLSRLLLIAMVAMVFLSASPSLHAAQEAGLTVIPPGFCNAGGTRTAGLAVSGDGKTLVGICYDLTFHPGTDFEHAFIWTEEHGLMELGFLDDRPHTVPTGVSEDGSVVVGYAEHRRDGTRPADELSYEAFIWTPETGLIGLGTLGDAPNSLARAVSGDGFTVVGTAGSNAFIWTPEAGMRQLDSLEGGSVTPMGISADGKVAVGYSTNFATDDRSVVRWSTETLARTNLGFKGQALAASADGSVIVGGTYDGAWLQEPMYAFRWTASGGKQTISSIPSVATAVSEDGSIVVGRTTGQYGVAVNAFRWTEATGMVYVDDWLRSLGVVVDDLDMYEANGVSYDGNVIVGSASNQAYIARGLPLLSDEVRWTGAESADWEDEENWEPEEIPTMERIAIIDTTAPNATVLTGSGSAAALTVANEGLGDLTVRGGGSLSTGQAVLGGQAGSLGIVTVLGDGTVWNISEALYVGNKGTGVLGVGDAATVLSGAVTIGLEGTALGVVEVHTQADLHVTGALTIGASGSGKLSLVGGGTLFGSGITLGTEAGSEGDLTISGAQSAAISSQPIQIGRGGRGTLTITDGGRLESGAAQLAFLSGSSADATVSGSGSTWTVSGELIIAGAAAAGVNVTREGELHASNIVVGEGGIGTLTVTSSGLVRSDLGSIGGKGAGQGSALIESEGSWNIASALIVGDEGSGRLTVGAGGLVLAESVSIGYEGGSQGEVALAGTGAQVVTGLLEVGTNGEGALTVASGASFDSEEAYLGVLPAGGGSVKVSGAGARWKVAGDLDVGREGRGLLTIQHGGVVDAAGHTVTIAREATATGGIVIGDLDVQHGVAPGVLLANEVVFGQGLTSVIYFSHNSAGYMFEPDIKGVGEIEHLSGTTTLAGDASAFAGMTRLKGGKLIVNGTLGGSLEWTGGTVGGTGTLPATTVPPDATVSPGNSIGTLRVAEITFEPGSTYEVEVNSQGESDRIEVTGEATLGGGLVLVLPDPDFAVGMPYTILTAAVGVTGTFDDSAPGGGYVFIVPTLEYEPNAVILTIEVSGADFTSVANTANQKAVAAAIEDAGPGDPLWNSMAVLDVPGALAAFDAVGGELHASARTALIEEVNIVRQTVRSHLGAEEGAPESSGFWGELLGARSAWPSDGNAAAYARSLTGGLVGWSGGDSGTWRYGAWGGLGYGDHRAEAVHSSAQTQTMHLGTFVDMARREMRVQAGASYSTHTLRTERQVRFSGLDETNEAAYNARTVQLFGSVERSFVYGPVTLRPFAEVSWHHLTTEAFAERGDGAGGPGNLTALTAQSGTVQMTTAEIGVRAATNFRLGAFPGDVYAGIGWHQVFGGRAPEVEMSLANGASFAVAGVPFGQGLNVEAGMNLDLTHRMSLGVSYEGHLGNVADHRWQLGLRVQF